MEFSMPVRVRWDLDFRGRVGRAKRIARRIREASPFLVEIRIEGEKGLSLLPAVLAGINECAPRVEATVKLFPGAGAAARRGYPVDFIWGISPGEPFLARLPEGAAAVSFVPDEETFHDLPAILEEFSGSDLSTLHLPNVNAVRAVAEKGHVPVPGPLGLREAARRIPELGVSLGGKKLVVHDFFLWRLLRESFPVETGERVEFSGCQAGSSLAYVDWEGNVYPCDSLPVRLGNLGESTFEEIWRSPPRGRILDAIRSVPAYCGSCDSLSGCLSGCRGLAYVASGGFDAPDPACPGKPGGSPPHF